MSDTSYAQAWNEYRGLRIRCAVFVALFVVLPTYLAKLSGSIFDTTIPALVVTFVLMMASADSLWRLINWPCPRCGERFGVPRGLCRHCGLPRWSEAD
jgi:hypothetical protein